jgi:uncharacterized FAD-dependent dehydrogenase
MLRINNIKVSLDYDFKELKKLSAQVCKISESQIKNVKLAKKSVDARKKSDIHFILSIDIEAENEEKILKICKDASAIKEFRYEIPKVSDITRRPVIIGFGPAGMFAALVLAESGACPIVIERGENVDDRKKSVDEFWEKGILNEKSNVQFGEGGAGTFSDGKLTTGTKDERIQFVLKTFVKFGAPEEILYLAKPHIGTDKLQFVVKKIREYIISKGGEIRFNSLMKNFTCDDGKITEIITEENGIINRIKTDYAILAVGHSARDTFELLYKNNIEIMQKSFSVGVRIEHLRKDIDKALYGSFAGHKALKAADYKQVVHLQNGRSLYTFCMCPGGYVVAAASENGRIATNGMSFFNRDGENSNSALLVGIDPSDFGSSHPLAGMYLQRKIVENAFKAGGCDFYAPVTRVGTLLGIDSKKCFGKVIPTYKPGVRFAGIDEYLPEFVCDTIKKGIPEIGRKIKGFDDGDALITGVESRSSSPVRIKRCNETMCSVSLKGLYPCGEGAGYAGGIVSAAVDGMKCAEAIISDMLKQQRS